MSASYENTYQTTVDAVTEPPRDETDRAQTAEEATAAAGHPLALPPAGEARANGMALGETVRLDHLGPMVVNRDGSLSRITNWDRMTEGEQQDTRRVIGARNARRLEALREHESQPGSCDQQPPE